MKIDWANVGAPPKPIQETQHLYISMTTTSWGNGPAQLPQLPMGSQPKPYVLTGGGSGSR